MLFMTVTQTLLPKYIGGVSESQISVLVGGELSAEILVPGSIPAVNTHMPMMVEHLQVFPGDGQRHGDLHSLFFLVEIPFPDLVRTVHCPYGVQNRGFSGIVFPHQDQGIFNVPDFHIPYVFKIFDMKAVNVHKKSPFSGRLSGPVLIYFHSITVRNVLKVVLNSYFRIGGKTAGICLYAVRALC